MIVDKYNKCLVIQILTAGMENFKEMIIKILDDIFKPEIIILRNDSHSRLKEGLKLEKTIVKGALNEFHLIIEDDIKFLFNPLHGQKTGFFLIKEKIELSLKILLPKGKDLIFFVMSAHGAFIWQKKE